MWSGVCVDTRAIGWEDVIWTGLGQGQGQGQDQGQSQGLAIHYFNQGQTDMCIIDQYKESPTIHCEALHKKIQYVSNCTLGYILVSHGVGTYLSYKNQKFSAPNKGFARATKKSSVYPAAHKRQ